MTNTDERGLTEEFRFLAGQVSENKEQLCAIERRIEHGFTILDQRIENAVRYGASKSDMEEALYRFAWKVIAFGFALVLGAFALGLILGAR